MIDGFGPEDPGSGRRGVAGIREGAPGKRGKTLCITRSAVAR